MRFSRVVIVEINYEFLKNSQALLCALHYVRLMSLRILRPNFARIM